MTTNHQNKKKVPIEIKNFTENLNFSNFPIYVELVTDEMEKRGSLEILSFFFFSFCVVNDEQLRL